MSDKVHLSYIDDGLEVSLGAARMKISELRIRPTSNWATPFELLGRGGSSLMLTDSQVCQLLGEWCHMSLCNHGEEKVSYAYKSVRTSVNIEINNPVDKGEK